MMTAFARTIILYFLIMVGLRLMGKRQIGELEPSELVLTMMISDLATVPMQDFGRGHPHPDASGHLHAAQPDLPASPAFPGHGLRHTLGAYSQW